MFCDIVSCMLRDEVEHSVQFIPAVICISRFSPLCMAWLQKGKAVQAGVPRNLVYNAINQSELLSKADLENFHLEEEGPVSWKLLGAGNLNSA